MERVFGYNSDMDIVKIVEEALKDAVGGDNVEVEWTSDLGHGDLTSNVALQTGRSEKDGHSGAKRSEAIESRSYQSSRLNRDSLQDDNMSPREVAEGIKEKLSKDIKLQKYISNIEVAGPGFINFWLSEEYLAGKLNDKKDGSMQKKGKVMFEYGDANTHKLPHIGHLFSYIYGEAMTRILEETGWEVYRACYQGDIGPQVAKCIWAYRKGGFDEPEGVKERAELLQKLYQEGSKAYEEDDNAKEEINELNKKIYQGDSSILPVWNKTRQWSIDYYDLFEKRLGINYDRHYFESEVQGRGKEIVASNVGKVFKESEGAIIFEGSKYGLHDRVFVTKFGTPMYEAKDLYLQELKFSEWPADLLVITTANEQNDYFKVVFRALETLHPEYKGKLKHVGFGMINLKGGKMSSRTGNILGGIELVETVVERVGEQSRDKKTAEVVGLGAIKYSFLKSNPLHDTKFDLEESIAAEGNSGPYLQYTYARIQSLLGKAQFMPPLTPPTIRPRKNSLLAPDLRSVVGGEKGHELELVRRMVRFSGVVVTAAESYSPNLICNYLYDLASAYNSFYNANRIIGEEREQERLYVSDKVSEVIKKGLFLLGIEAPEKM
jgi:arginyl-tRNA synthetase